MARKVYTGSSNRFFTSAYGGWPRRTKTDYQQRRAPPSLAQDVTVFSYGRCSQKTKRVLNELNANNDNGVEPDIIQVDAAQGRS